MIDGWMKHLLGRYYANLQCCCSFVKAVSRFTFQDPYLDRKYWNETWGIPMEIANVGILEIVERALTLS